MNFLPIALLFLLLRSKGTANAPANAAEILQTVSSLKESGVFELFQQKNPLEALLSGKIPPDKLIGLLSAFSALRKNKPEAQTKNPVPYAVTGEELGNSLLTLLDATRG